MTGFRSNSNSSLSDRQKKKAKIGRVVISTMVVIGFLLPVLLNIYWGYKNIEWMYWASSLLCYGQLMLVGFLILVIPHKLINWLKYLIFAENFDIENNTLDGLGGFFIRLAAALMLIGSGSIGLYILIARLLRGRGV